MCNDPVVFEVGARYTKEEDMAQVHGRPNYLEPELPLLALGKSVTTGNVA